MVVGGPSGVCLSAFEFGRHYAFFGTKGVLRGGPSYKKFTGADILVHPHGGAEPRRVIIPPPTTGHGGALEEVVLADRALQIMGAAWLLVFAVGVYAT